MNDDELGDNEFDISDAAILAGQESDDDDDDDVDSEGKLKAIITSDDDDEKIIDKEKERTDKKKRKLEALKKQRNEKISSRRLEDTDRIHQLSTTDMHKMFLSSQPHDPNLSRISLDLSNFSSYENILEFSSFHLKAIATVFPSLKKNLRPENLTETGSPKALVICASSTRACEIIKDISSVLQSKIAKLYAKHFKVHEQVAMLKEKVAIAVGTPNRIFKLLEIGLSLSLYLNLSLLSYLSTYVYRCFVII